MSEEPVVWRNYRPSNGTEGAYQRAQLCDRCEVDHPWHAWYANGEKAKDQPEDSCPIIMDAMFGDHSYSQSEDGPPEWSYYPEEGIYECSGFVGPCDCDWEREAMHQPGRRHPYRYRPPRPKIDPNQPSLFGSLG